MADSLADLFVRLSGDTSDFKAAFQDASDQLDKFAESAGGISGVVEALTGLAEALGVVEGLKALSDLGEQFEEASNKIVTLTGAMGDALESLEGTFTTVFTSVPQGMQDVAAAVGALSAILHPTADDLADLSTQLLNLSRITGESIGPLVTDTAHLFQQWGLDVQDGAAALDHFNQVAQATGTPVSQIEGMLTQFGPALRNLGVDAAQAADLIGTLAQQGLNAQQILAGMQRAEANLGKAGVTDLAAGFQMLVGAIQNASSAGQALQIGAAAFGARGAGPIVAAIQSGSIDFTTFQNQIDTTNESIDDQAARVETLGQKWSTFVNQLENDLKPAAELIVGFLEGILTGIEFVVSGIESLWDTIAHPPSLPNMTEGIATGDQANEIAQLQAIIANHNQQLGAKQINVSPLDSTGANVLTATQYINNMTAALQAAGGKALDFGYAVTTATDGTITLSAAVDGTGKAAGNSANAFDQWLAKTTSGYKLLKEQLTNLQQAYQMQSGTGIIQLQISNLQRQVGNPNYGDQLTQYDNYLNEKIKLAKASGQAISDDDVANAAHTAALLQQMTMTTPAAFTLLGISGTDTLETQEQLIQAALDKITSSAYATDGDITRATQAALAKDIALWRQYGADVTDSQIEAAADMKAAWAQAHMDLQQAFSTLGVTSSNDSVNSYLTQLAAVAKIQQSFNEGTATSDDLANAQIAALSKEQAALAALGEAMSDADVSQLAYLQNQKQIAAMTTQGAFTNLGMASPDQLQNNLDLITASYAKVVAVVGDSGSQADAAWLSFLNKAVSDTQAAGKQIGDALASALEAAQAQVQLDAVNIVNAFSGLGVTSGQKLGEIVTLIQAQMTSALSTVAAGSTQADQIILAGLTQVQAAFQRSGTLVPQDLADQIQALQAKMTTALMTTQQAYTTLGVTSEATYQNQITAAQHALDILNATGAPIQALIQGNEDLLAIQIKLGTLQGDDVTAYMEQLQNAKMQIDALTLASQGLGNIYIGLTNDFTNAFSTLGKGIADNLIDWKNWGTTISGLVDQVAKTILETLVGGAFKQLAAASLTWIESLSSGLTSAIAPLLKIIGGPALGAAATGANTTASGANTTASGANTTALGVNTTGLGVNTTALGTLTGAVIALTGAMAPVAPAVVANTAVHIPNTAAVAAAAAAAVPVAAGLTVVAGELPPLAVLLASGNVIQATMTAVDSTISFEIPGEIAAQTAATAATLADAAVETSDIAVTGAQAAAIIANSGLIVTETAADVADTTAEIANTAAVVADTAAATAEAAASTAAAGAGALGGIGSALGGILGSLGAAAAANPFGAISAGVGIASGIVMGDELAQIDNKLWVLVSSNQGILNQLISLQNSANQYWPQLDHLTDIWGAIVTLTTVTSQDLQALTGNAGASGNSLDPLAAAMQQMDTDLVGMSQMAARWLPRLDLLTDIDSQAQQTVQQLVSANVTLNAIETYFQRGGSSPASASSTSGPVTDNTAARQNTQTLSGLGTGHAIPASGLTAPGALQGGEIIDPSIVSGNTAALADTTTATQAVLPALADNTAAINAAAVASAGSAANLASAATVLGVASPYLALFAQDWNLPASEVLSGSFASPGAGASPYGSASGPSAFPAYNPATYETVGDVATNAAAQQAASMQAEAAAAQQAAAAAAQQAAQQVQNLATAMSVPGIAFDYSPGQIQTLASLWNQPEGGNMSSPDVPGSTPQNAVDGLYMTVGDAVTNSLAIQLAGFQASAMQRANETAASAAAAAANAAGRPTYPEMGLSPDWQAWFQSGMKGPEPTDAEQIQVGTIQGQYYANDANPGSPIAAENPWGNGPEPESYAQGAGGANPSYAGFQPNFQVQTGGGETQSPSPWTPSNYAPVNTNSIGAFSYPNGVPPAVGTPSSSSSPSSVNNTLTVIANTSASRDILKGFVQGVNQMGISLR